ncbi:hypothetical protein [uncultured Lacinutrix sp.]|uniref:hypothetical protein n=1 Tax=uncultured Lacinutrix sp. TaxID=574032 RepID=UPI002611E186|nr:hypothetical protein [uncultured Lacinutrix sp.]
MKKTLPLIVIIASVILLLVNYIMSDYINRGFWLSTLSSALIIVSMALTIKANKDQDKD